MRRDNLKCFKENQKMCYTGKCEHENYWGECTQSGKHPDDYVCFPDTELLSKKKKEPAKKDDDKEPNQ